MIPPIELTRKGFKALVDALGYADAVRNQLLNSKRVSPPNPQVWGDKTLNPQNWGL